MISGLVHTGEQDWEPRLIRSTTLNRERPSGPLLVWTTLEALALVIQFAGSEPLEVVAIEAPVAQSSREDFISLNLRFEHAVATVQVGFDEASESRKTLIATAGRKTYVDELDSAVPLRILDGENVAPGTSSRWVACPAPTSSDLARLHIVAFLEAIHSRTATDSDAAVWLPAIAAWRTALTSLGRGGAPQPVLALVPQNAGQSAPLRLQPQPSLRLISG